MMQCTFCQLQLDEFIRRVLLPVGNCGDLRNPRNSNSTELLDSVQVQYFSFVKIHSPVPARRPSLMRWW